MSSGRKSRSRIFNSDWERVFNKNIGRYLQVIIAKLSILQNNEIDTKLDCKISLQQINDINRKKHTPIKREEIPFNIPLNWKWFRLGDIGICKTGTTPPTIDSDNFGNDIPFIKPADITLSGIVYNNEGLSTKGLNKGVLIPKNSLLMVCIGGSIGKSFYNSMDVSCNQQINTITPFAGNNVVFFQNFLQSEYFQKTIWAKASGGTTPIVNRSKWESILVPIPPSIEQDKIVAFLNDIEINNLNGDVYFNKEVENIIINIHHALLKGFTISVELTHQLNLLKKLRQQLLQDAIQGKLVEQNPDDEPASILLKKIKAEKEQLIKDKKLKKEKELPAIKPEEIPFDIPDNWVWCRLGEIVSILGDGLHGTPSYSSIGEYYFINGNNLINGKIEIKENTKKVSKVEFEKYKKLMNLNTILISINGTLGNIAFYDNEKIILGKSACYFTLLNNIDKNFIFELLKSQYFLKYAVEVASETTIKNVSLKSMRYFPVPLPPLAEQHCIIEKLNQLMQTCDALKVSIKQSQQQNEQLLQQVLREALTREAEPEAAI